MIQEYEIKGTKYDRWDMDAGKVPTYLPGKCPHFSSDAPKSPHCYFMSPW